MNCWIICFKWSSIFTFLIRFSLSKAFIFLGLNFTLELTNVSLVRGSAKDMPKILGIAKSAVLLIPEEAANSQVSSLVVVSCSYHRRKVLQRIPVIRTQWRFHCNQYNRWDFFIIICAVCCYFFWYKLF